MVICGSGIVRHRGAVAWLVDGRGRVEKAQKNETEAG